MSTISVYGLFVSIMMALIRPMLVCVSTPQVLYGFGLIVTLPTSTMYYGRNTRRIPLENSGKHMYSYRYLENAAYLCQNFEIRGVFGPEFGKREVFQFLSKIRGVFHWKIPENTCFPTGTWNTSRICVRKRKT